MLDSHENFETLRICKIKKIKKKVPDDVEEKTERWRGRGRHYSIVTLTMMEIVRTALTATCRHQ